MKKEKLVKPFHFKNLMHEDVVNILNEERPINLKHNEDLIDRISLKYPYLNKSDISLIVKTIFQSFRELLVLGKVLNFNNLFFDTKFHFFKYQKDGHILPSLKVKISTPPPLRKNGKF